MSFLVRSFRVRASAGNLRALVAVSFALAVPCAAQDSAPSPVEPPSPPPSPPAVSVAPSPDPSSSTYDNWSNDYPRYPNQGGVVMPRMGDVPTVRPKLIFFPPNPPPLGVEVSMADRRNARSAPAELSDFINEPFYAPLSTRLFEREMDDSERRRLDDYRTLKKDLLEQLRQRLRDLRDVDAAARLRALAQLSIEQTPKIVELENAAEQLRSDLFSRGWMSDGAGNWYGLRGWRLGCGELAKPREEVAFFEYEVMRAAAYYQEKLSPAQRRLLREIAMEMEDDLFHTDKDAPVQSPFVFFAPETARVIFPEELPPPVRARIDGFREEKDAIKRALRDTIFESDRALFTSGRNSACEQLARDQQPRIDALEAAAERIRRDLALVPAFERLSPAASVPPAVQADIDRYVEEKIAVAVGLTQRVQAAGAKIRRPSSTDPLAVREWIAERKRLMQEAAQEYRDENAERLAAMDALLERVRASVEKIDQDVVGFSVGSLDDRFLAEFLAALRHKESTYDYWAAAFEPGMSPQQRRLLYDGAVAAMGLQLPGPEKQPTSLPGTILR